MKLKQIKFLFKRLFSRRKARIHMTMANNAVLMDVAGNGGQLCTMLEHLLTSEELKPLIAEVQAKIVKDKIGIDPREVIAHAMEGAMTEHFGHPHAHRHEEKKEKAVN